MICHLSNARKYCQIQFNKNWINWILPKVCDLKAIYWDNTKNFLSNSYGKPVFHINLSPSKYLDVKTLLDVAGIDVSIFSAHSTCHVFTSFAANKGINVEITRIAGNNSSDIFVRFYNRSIIKDPAFQGAILNT